MTNEDENGNGNGNGKVSRESENKEGAESTSALSTKVDVLLTEKKKEEQNEVVKKTSINSSNHDTHTTRLRRMLDFINRDHHHHHHHHHENYSGIRGKCRYLMISKYFVRTLLMVLLYSLIVIIVVAAGIGQGFYALVAALFTFPVIFSLLKNVQFSNAYRPRYRLSIGFIGVLVSVALIISCLALIVGASSPNANYITFAFPVSLTIILALLSIAWTIKNVYPPIEMEHATRDNNIAEEVEEVVKEVMYCPALLFILWLFYAFLVFLYTAEVLSATAEFIRFEPDESNFVLVGVKDYGDGIPPVPHKLHYTCFGPENAPEPYVLFEHGMGGSPFDMTWIQRTLTANGIRSCSYSRAGYGYSQPGKTPRMAAVCAQDINDLVDFLGWKSKKIVFVVHSLGGFHSRVYQALYGKDHVKGIVFADAVNPKKDALCSLTSKIVSEPGAVILRPLYAMGFARILVRNSKPVKSIASREDVNNDIREIIYGTVLKMDGMAQQLPEDVRDEFTAYLLRVNWIETGFNELSHFARSCGFVAEVATTNSTSFRTTHVVAGKGIYSSKVTGEVEGESLALASQLGLISANHGKVIIRTDADHLSIVVNEAHANAVAQEALLMIQAIRAE